MLPEGLNPYVGSGGGLGRALSAVVSLFAGPAPWAVILRQGRQVIMRCIVWALRAAAAFAATIAEWALYKYKESFIFRFP